MDRDGEKLISGLIGFGVVLTLIWLLLIAAVVTLATVAAFFIGWYLTHVLYKAIDAATDGQFSTEHAGMLPIVAGLFWAFVAWMFVPELWLHWLTLQFPTLGNVSYLAPMVGAAFGLAWSVLVLFLDSDHDETTLLDGTGMYTFSEAQLLEMDSETTELVNQGIFLGTDVDA